MLEDKLCTLVRDKAALVQLSYQDVKVLPLDPDEGGYAVLDEQMEMDLRDGIITLRVADMAGVSSSRTERLIEYLLCTCKEEAEGSFWDGVLAPGPRSIQLITLEMFNTYMAYHTSRRYIDTFGEDMFIQYQMEGLPEFVTRQRERFGQLISAGDVVNGILAVVAHYKEQIKCDKMPSGIETTMPPVISALTAPFAPCFDTIHTSGMQWLEKSKLLYVMANVQLSLVNVPLSYHVGKLIGNEEETRQPILDLFKQTGFLDATGHALGQAIERRMRDAYGTARGEIKPVTN